ncbi:type VI secretion system PAAR protein [Aeromonas veronii]|nr:type VI secretion system PAAR protein [Aeromonas veronii]
MELLMKAAIVGNIGTDHDGFKPTKITAGSPDVMIDGMPVARVGDPLEPHDKPNNPPHPRAIDSGISNILINGKPIAMTGAAIDCGGVIIGDSSVIVGNMSVSANSQSSVGFIPPLSFDEQIQLMAAGKPVSDYPYYAINDAGEVISGRTDSAGLTKRIKTQKEGEFAIYWGDEALALMEGVISA